AGLVYQLAGVAERVHERPVLDAPALERLERDPDARPHGLGRELAEAVDDEGPRVVGAAAAGGPRQAEDRGGLERGEPVQRGAERVDPRPRAVRPGQKRQGPDRRDRGPGASAAEAARRQEPATHVLGPAAA